MELSLNDGTTVTVPLHGFGKLPQILNLSTSDINNDTVGGTIYIPIHTDPLIAFGDLDLSVHFDTSMLIYRGTYQPGSSTDQTTGRSDGFARLHFDQNTVQSSGNILGYATFDIFPLHVPCTTVVFDSISVMSSKGVICALAEPSFSSEICANIICGTASLSGFLRYLRMPDVTISPNPSAGITWIRSDRDIGNTSIFVYDQLGRLQLKIEDVLSPLHPAEINLSSIHSGMYSLRIESNAYNRSQPLMLLH
jgi:hypothetical protein